MKTEKEYNLKFNLQNMCEDGVLPKRKIFKKCKVVDMNSDVLINQVLLNLSKDLDKKDDNGDEINIEFKTKNKWNGFIKLRLASYTYNEWGTIRYTWEHHDFSEIYKVERESIFNGWTSITFCNIRRNHIINLDYPQPGDPHLSHYSGHYFISWWDYTDDAFRKVNQLDEEFIGWSFKS